MTTEQLHREYVRTLAQAVLADGSTEAVHRMRRLHRAAEIKQAVARQTVTCPHCNGAGSFYLTPERCPDCPDCRGDGEVTRREAKHIREHMELTDEDIRNIRGDIEYHRRVDAQMERMDASV